jgi:hypothetical protein
LEHESFSKGDYAYEKWVTKPIKTAKVRIGDGTKVHELRIDQWEEKFGSLGETTIELKFSEKDMVLTITNNRNFLSR